jgi:hypothetical protein
MRKRKDCNTPFRKYWRDASEVGLVPGTAIQVEAYSYFDENLTLLVGEKEKVVVIGPAISSRIFVETNPPQNLNKE